MAVIVTIEGSILKAWRCRRCGLKIHPPEARAAHEARHQAMDQRFRRIWDNDPNAWGNPKGKKGLKGFAVKR
jgi:hypothetical protein